MRHARFRDPSGAVRRGEWHGDAVSFAGERYDLEEVELLAPTEPSKIVCVGRNYVAHAEETDSDVPDRPLLFLKGPNTVAGHGDTVTLPEGKERVEWEAELGVVISDQAKNVDAEDAMEYVEGFTCVDDVSNRDDQRTESQWVRGKAFDGAAPIGPCLADPEHVPADAEIRSIVNGEVKQAATTDLLVFDVPTLIEEITSYLTLEAGDVIATGTPEGVGPFEDGDEVEIEVEGVGTLEHSVRRP
ncbi:MAG: fumarylacetoacetate hydrolase family protein [Halolamina sp.]|uniref:fumarylacetoacetate hydrolase family protein n=1 Tax=Halolamina sp. TaxID=1940283 RepID=UPI002FC2FA44